MGCESFDVVRLNLGPLLQDQIRVAKLSACLLMKNAVYLLNYVSWPLSVDISCIWPQMRPWSSLTYVFRSLELCHKQFETCKKVEI